MVLSDSGEGGQKTLPSLHSRAYAGTLGLSERGQEVPDIPCGAQF